MSVLSIFAGCLQTNGESASSVHLEDLNFRQEHCACPWEQEEMRKRVCCAESPFLALEDRMPCTDTHVHEIKF